MQSWSR